MVKEEKKSGLGGWLAKIAATVIGVVLAVVAYQAGLFDRLLGKGIVGNHASDPNYGKGVIGSHESQWNRGEKLPGNKVPGEYKLHTHPDKDNFYVISSATINGVHKNYAFVGLINNNRLAVISIQNVDADDKLIGSPTVTPIVGLSSGQGQIKGQQVQFSKALDGEYQISSFLTTPSQKPGNNAAPRFPTKASADHKSEPMLGNLVPQVAGLSKANTDISRG